MNALPGHPASWSRGGIDSQLRASYNEAHKIHYHALDTVLSPPNWTQNVEIIVSESSTVHIN